MEGHVGEYLACMGMRSRWRECRKGCLIHFRGEHCLMFSVTSQPCQEKRFLPGKWQLVFQCSSSFHFSYVYSWALKNYFTAFFFVNCWFIFSLPVYLSDFWYLLLLFLKKKIIFLGDELWVLNIIWFLICFWMIFFGCMFWKIPSYSRNFICSI